jgi:hypothetical protein
VAFLLVGRWAHTEVVKPRSAASRRHLPASPFNVHPARQPVETFAVADRVNHDTYGLGRVAAVEESTVVVDFTAGRMRIPAPYNKLVKL